MMSIKDGEEGSKGNKVELHDIELQQCSLLRDTCCDVDSY